MNKVEKYEKEQLVIIDWHSYGTLTDVYKWCEYLRENYDITLLSFKTENSARVQDGIKNRLVYYDRKSKLKKMRARVLFVLWALWLILRNKGKTMIVYFPACHWLKRVFPWKKMHLDVRTLSVDEDENIRSKYDKKLINCCLIFDSVSAISDGVKSKIGREDISILPLGSDIISETAKKYDSEIRMLYIGTLDGRKLSETIEGVRIFHDANPDVKISYDIIGNGRKSEVEEINDCILNKNMQNIVTYHGYMNHSQSHKYFDQANIGCAFVPITDYYDYQPPTKVFEYALSGLYTIATRTKANMMYIDNYNGELISDTAQDMANALENYLSKRNFLDEGEIRNSLKDYVWQSIVKKKLIPILNRL